ncbi:hypothetical protein GH733_000483 [Mirounga leonina]|nr:hypothetical protein GH733_000483 [Mirounga leonina]
MGKGRPRPGETPTRGVKCRVRFGQEGVPSPALAFRTPSSLRRGPLLPAAPPVSRAQACVLVFSTTDRESFEAISSWREKVVAEVGDIPTVLVQNKIDLLDDSCIKNEEAEALAKKLKLRFYRTSVKEDLNVTEVFKYLAEKYLQKLKQQIAEDPELMHSSSNKIGVFNTSIGSHSGQNSSTLNGGDVINLRPNKQRTKKNRNPFSSSPTCPASACKAMC